MRNYDKIKPADILPIVEVIIKDIIQGLSKIGFRKKTNERLNALEDLAILQDKRIKELEKQ